MSVTRNRYTVGIVLFVLATSVSCIFLVIDKQYSSLGLLGAFVGFFVFMMLDRVEQMARLEQLAAAVDTHGPLATLARAIIGGHQSSIVKLSSSEAISYTEGRMNEVHRMYNTSFTISRSVLSTPYRRWLNVIAHNVSIRDCIVEEVVSSPKRVEVIQSQLAARPRGEYEAHFLSFEHNWALPYIETCVFEGSDGRLEVLFGWSSHSSHYSGDDVFLSRDEHIAKYFLGYFRRLKELAIVQTTATNGPRSNSGLQLSETSLRSASAAET
jgi:hypothetical protein